MARIHWRIVAVSSDGRRSTMDEHTAAARAEQAAAYPPRDDTAELLARADALAAERADAARRDLAARNEGREQAEREIAAIRPAWEKAALVAEQIGRAHV